MKLAAPSSSAASSQERTLRGNEISPLPARICSRSGGVSWLKPPALLLEGEERDLPQRQFSSDPEGRGCDKHKGDRSPEISALTDRRL